MSYGSGKSPSPIRTWFAFMLICHSKFEFDVKVDTWSTRVSGPSVLHTSKPDRICLFFSEGERGQGMKGLTPPYKEEKPNYLSKVY